MKKLLILLLIVGCTTEPEDVRGCTDAAACNYDATASLDNNSCVYSTEYYDCEGSCIVETDCGGECGKNVYIWGQCYNIDETTSLVLYHNQLTGGIPSEIGNLTNLTVLLLDQNQLSGSIPPEIGNLTNLNSMELYENQLTGSIPSEIGNLTNLARLTLRSNQLSGDIPQEVCDLIDNINISISDILSGNPDLSNTCE